MKLYLFRGLPGDGKSTKAKKTGYIHVEADQFFMINGKYCYNQKFIKDAHAWCQAMVKYHLYQGNDIAVSNTFITNWEMKPYFKMAKLFGANISVFEATGNFGSIHNVPESVIQQMKEKWEELILN